MIWNKKKLSWANISKMNGYFGKNFGDLSEFLPARLTTKCSQSFRFFKWKNWLYWKHLYCTLEKNVVYYSALCFIIETKLTMKFPHLFVIFPSLSLWKDTEYPKISDTNPGLNHFHKAQKYKFLHKYDNFHDCNSYCRPPTIFCSVVAGKKNLLEKISFSLEP